MWSVNYRLGQKRALAVDASAGEFIVCTLLGTLVHLPDVLIAYGYLEKGIHFHACVRSTGIRLQTTVASCGSQICTLCILEKTHRFNSPKVPVISKYLIHTCTYPIPHHVHAHVCITPALNASSNILHDSGYPSAGGRPPSF